MRNFHKSAADLLRETGAVATASEEKPVAVETKKSKDSKNVALATQVQQLDLFSIDFTSEKFALIAKVVSEKAPRKPNMDRSAAKTCKTCDKSFASTSAFALHMTRHKPDAQTACDLCDRSFQTAKLFKEHTLMTHERDDVIAGYCDLPDNEENSRMRKVVSKDEFMLVMGLKMTRVVTTKPLPTVVQPQIRVMEDSVSLSGGRVQLDANQNLVKAFSPDASAPAQPKSLLDLKFHRVIPKGSDSSPSEIPFATLSQLSSAFQEFKFQFSQAGGKSQNAPNQLVSTPCSLLAPGAAMNLARSFLTVLSSTPVVNKSQLDSTKSDTSSPLKVPAFESVITYGLDTESRILPPTGPLQDSSPVDALADDSNESGNPLTGLETPDKDDNSGPHACQYCDEIYYNYRSFKGE